MLRTQLCVHHDAVVIVIWVIWSKCASKRTKMRVMENPEGAQRRAARFVRNDYNYTSSVTEMMRALEWESLQQRRHQAKSVMMYRIVNSLVDIPQREYLHPQGTAVTRGHQCRFMVPYSRTDTFRMAFFPSAIRLWNQLPESIVNAPSLDVFKTGIAAALSL